MTYRVVVVFILVVSCLVGCKSAPIETTPTSKSTREASTPIPPTYSPIPNTATPQPSPISELTAYEFPDSIDPAKRYMFYLHGKIIEDQGIPAISPGYGKYEYEAILEKLSGYGFVVVSEQRAKNTDSTEYAKKITEDVTMLLDAGVPAKNITVVGASKGAAIAVYVSHFLDNSEVNFVIMAICHPDVLKDFKRDQISLKGNVLSIYDFADDEYAGSCEALFLSSEGKGLSRYDEIVVHVGTGHGILYKPLDEWVLPVVQWANNNAE